MASSRVPTPVLPGSAISLAMIAIAALWSRSNRSDALECLPCGESLFMGANRGIKRDKTCLAFSCFVFDCLR